jgi:hypothetical protein
MNVTSAFDWTDAGQLTLASGDQIIFPSLPQSPGVYRFDCLAETDSWLYIGEADNLKNRMGSYGKPGPTQDTNIRLNALLRDALRDGERISLAVTTAATLEVDGIQIAANLNDVFVRRLIEDAAIVAAVIAGTRIINKRRSKKVANQ